VCICLVLYRGWRNKYSTVKTMCMLFVKVTITFLLKHTTVLNMELTNFVCSLHSRDCKDSSLSCGYIAKYPHDHELSLYVIIESLKEALKTLTIKQRMLRLTYAYRHTLCPATYISSTSIHTQVSMWRLFLRLPFLRWRNDTYKQLLNKWRHIASQGTHYQSTYLIDPAMCRVIALSIRRRPKQ